jgi:hypothetical protein
MKWLLFVILIEKTYMQFNCNRKGYYNEITKKCECVEGFNALPGYDEPNCLYGMKYKKVCLLLSMFWGYSGVDQFYLGKNTRGLIKVGLPICLFGLIGYAKVRGFKWKYIDRFINSSIPDFYYAIPFVIIGLFWIVDVILILFNNVKDAYGFTLL